MLLNTNWKYQMHIFGRVFKCLAGVKFTGGVTCRKPAASQIMCLIVRIDWTAVGLISIASVSRG